MLSVHFNGEIVRHGDRREISNHIKETNDKERRCKYGLTEIVCPAWRQFCERQPEVKRLSDYGRCFLGGCTKCPAFKMRKDSGNKEKWYSITWDVYRKLSSAAHYLIKEQENKSVFLTLTFGKFKKNGITETEANKCLSRFTKNMRENYLCNGYIAVRERGTKNNRLHFHILLNIPFVDFAILNNCWNHAISDFCQHSNCALQTDNRYSAVINNPARAIRYVCKYFSKSMNLEYDSKVYFISNNLLSSQYEVDEKQPDGTIKTVTKTQSNIVRQIRGNYNLFDALAGLKSIEIHTFPYVTTFKVTAQREFNKYCCQFLYPIFECSLKKSEFRYLKAA
jgi:hypothetical protein